MIIPGKRPGAFSVNQTHNQQVAGGFFSPFSSAVSTSSLYKNPIFSFSE